jgi:hypothetical protein
MGRQEYCEGCSTHPRQQSTNADVWGEGDKRGETVGGREDRIGKGQGGGNSEEITLAPLNQFQINFLPTPRTEEALVLFSHASWE